MAGINAEEREGGEVQGTDTKRKMGDLNVPQEEAATPSKRPRPSPAADEAAAGGSAEVEGVDSPEKKADMLPALPLEKAVEATATASGLKLELNTTRVEVCWEVADDEAEDPKTITLW